MNKPFFLFLVLHIVKYRTFVYNICRNTYYILYDIIFQFMHVGNNKNSIFTSTKLYFIGSVRLGENVVSDIIIMWPSWYFCKVLFFFFFHSYIIYFMIVNIINVPAVHTYYNKNKRNVYNTAQCIKIYNIILFELLYCSAPCRAYNYSIVIVL
jgi:hypothetical protein